MQAVFCPPYSDWVEKLKEAKEKVRASDSSSCSIIV